MNMKNILIILLFTFGISYQATAQDKWAVVPMIHLTYDLNLKFSAGGGAAVGKRNPNAFNGAYAAYTYSLSKRGNNISVGAYTGVGWATGRIGINRMFIKSDQANKVYWGIEVSPTIVFFHLRGGLMFETGTKESNRFKPNLGVGLGLF